MTASTFLVKDANAVNVTFAADDNNGVKTTYHLEDTTQRAALLAALAATQPVSIASVPLAPGAATFAGQSTGNNALGVIAAALAGTLAVTGPLTSAQLTSAALATSAKQDAIVSAIGAATYYPATQPVSAVSLPLPTGAATDAKVEAVRALLASTLAISASSLPLPAGASTAALQVSGNTALGSIVTALAATLKADTVVQSTAINRGASVGTTATTLMAANASRRGFSIQNQHATANIYISGVATATADFNCLMIPAGQYYESPPHHSGTGTISIISSSASTPVYAREW